MCIVNGELTCTIARHYTLYIIYLVNYISMGVLSIENNIIDMIKVLDLFAENCCKNPLQVLEMKTFSWSRTSCHVCSSCCGGGCNGAKLLTGEGVNMINNLNFLWQPNIKYIYGYGCLKIVDKLDLEPNSTHISQQQPVRSRALEVE